ncbi:MAG: hypothetical protein AUG50_00450 [Betaproteobacteria bacterium 13_1_20CM_3_63_8]|nr:MAG: hypothetical protein AUG50_00450 [Betaproteobacteria bacterium 13_1_20CM_3_63_8]
MASLSLTAAVVVTGLFRESWETTFCFALRVCFLASSLSAVLFSLIVTFAVLPGGIENVPLPSVRILVFLCFFAVASRGATSLAALRKVSVPTQLP